MFSERGAVPDSVEARRLSQSPATPLGLRAVVRSVSETFGQLPRGREGGNRASLHSVTDQSFG